MFRGRIFEYVSKNICGIIGVNKLEFENHNFISGY